jgi:hypothetical protein
MYRKRQAKVQKELEDAAKEVRNVVEMDDNASIPLGPESSPSLSVPTAVGGLDYCIVPKTASYVFVSFKIFSNL